MWQSRPVFISSTFADMQAERDYLRTRVFPELEERLRGRRHNLEWVDLRVGVATASERDERVHELHVLKVCLDEVRRCRPFLIVLLGGRYGWVPPEDRIKAVAEEAREGFSADVAGRSVTDLEIEFGVLSDPEQQPRSLFYFREPLPYAAMPAEVAALYCEDYATDAAHAQRKQRLTSLKRRIERHMPSRVRHYAVQWDARRQCVIGLEAFGRMVLEDIWSDLDAETSAAAAAADIPWQQAERDALEDFVDNRARNFVGRQVLIARLTGVCLSPAANGGPWGACVTGDPGSGKSALFGALYRNLGASDVFLLAHAPGASIASASVDSMLRRWIGELAAALGSDSGLAENTDPDKVEARFAQLLGRMARRWRVVMLVDALDQFEPTTRGRFITWLPRLWPENARLIATAIRGDASNALAQRPGVEALSLPPLDAVEASDIVTGICRRYHRTFEPEVIEALLAKGGPDGAAWVNPLWLVLAVEELNLFDADDFARAQRDYVGAPAERLRMRMLDTIAGFPTDIPRLYGHTFERADELFGSSLARGFLALIAVSRAGWRESDFRILLPRVSGENWDELKFAQLRRLFRGQLRRRGALAQWDFNHAQMRAAVYARLNTLGSPERALRTEQALHTQIADHLLSCRLADPLRISETMVHLLCSDDWSRAAGYYGDQALSEDAIEGATGALAEFAIGDLSRHNVPPEDVRELLLTLILNAENAELPVRALLAQRFLYNLGSVLERRGDLPVRKFLTLAVSETLGRRLLRLHPSSSALQRALMVAEERGGQVMQQLGDLAGARFAYEAATRLGIHLARDHPDVVECHLDLARCHQFLGQAAREAGDLMQAAESFRSTLSIMEALAARGIQGPRIQALHGAAWIAFGKTQADQGDFAGAERSYRQAVSTGGHFDTLVLAEAYSVLYEMQLARRDLAGAEASCRAMLVMAERQSRGEPTNAKYKSNMATSYYALGKVQEARGDAAGALSSYDMAATISQALCDHDPYNGEWLYQLAAGLRSTGEVQVRQGCLDDAEQSLRMSLAVAARLAGSDPENALWQRHLATIQVSLGTLHKVRGNLQEAAACYRAASALSETLVRRTPSNPHLKSNLAVTILNTGTVSWEVGNLAAAEQDFRSAIELWNSLLLENPGNDDAFRLEWLVQLKSGYMRLGLVQAEQARLPDAKESLDAFLKTAERLAVGSSSAGGQSQLAESYEKAGDIAASWGELSSAEAYYRRALAIGGRVVGHRLYDKLGDIQIRNGDPSGAEISLRTSLEIQQRVAGSLNSRSHDY
jgi:tetratricopeptide (TPR) repeat protein